MSTPTDAEQAALELLRPLVRHEYQNDLLATLRAAGLSIVQAPKPVKVTHRVWLCRHGSDDWLALKDQAFSIAGPVSVTFEVPAHLMEGGKS